MYLQPAGPTPPIPRCVGVVHAKPQLSLFRVQKVERWHPCSLFTAKREESAIRMKDGEVAFKVGHEVELHLGELVCVQGEVFDGVWFIYRSPPLFRILWG